MHVLMLGWEFPPFIAGGLGTACHGLTKALDRHGVEVTFVLPKAIDRSQSSHVNLLSPGMTVPAHSPPPRSNGSETPAAASPTANSHPTATLAPSPANTHSQAQPQAQQRTGELQQEPTQSAESFRHVNFIAVPSRFVNPYQRQLGSEGGNQPVGKWVVRQGVRTFLKQGEALHLEDVELADDQPYPFETSHQPGHAHSTQSPVASGPPPGQEYSGDLLNEVERFAAFCVTQARKIQFDVIHAHDWMTYPAGLAIARISGKPLVVHVHSTEFDRSGVHVNQRVYDIERRGMHGSMKVVAVSQLTKNVIMRRYGVPDTKVEVVYNGVDIAPMASPYGQGAGIQSKDKIVLYFGRITYQKGPEYFIQAAKRVLEMMPDVKFVVAGSGDQAARMIEMAAGLGIGHKVLFTGFLRGKDIQRVFAMADLYVMPSVSEPFGIAPLEAMAHQVPALISKSSGVSEVLMHALKVDFWDIDDMANKIIAVLRHPPLSSTLKEHGSFEVRQITWDGAASRCEQVYRTVMHQMSGTASLPA